MKCVILVNITIFMQVFLVCGQRFSNASPQVQSPTVQSNFHAATPNDALSSQSSLISRQIVGGTLTARGIFPWHVLLLPENKSICGGSLVAPDWVLTAAHCVAKYTFVDVHLGAYNRSDVSEQGRLVLTSRSKLVHPGFTPRTLANDIALVKLPSSVNITRYISVVRLPSVSDVESRKKFVAAPATLCGWGRTYDGQPSGSERLRCASVTILSNTQCVRALGPQLIRDSTLCTSTAHGRAACQGDSGGGLILQEGDSAWTLVGVVSFSLQSGCTKGPTAFSRVTSYLHWIVGNTNITLRH